MIRFRTESIDLISSFGLKPNRTILGNEAADIAVKETTE